MKLNNEEAIGTALKKYFAKSYKVKERSKIISVEITKTRTFSPDFYIPELDIYVEAKGKLWSERRLEYQAMAKNNLLDKVVFVFYRETRCPGLKKTNMEWAAKFGIKAVISKDLTPKKLVDKIKELL